MGTQNKDFKTALDVARDRKGDKAEKKGDPKETIAVLQGDADKGNMCVIA